MIIIYINTFQIFQLFILINQYLNKQKLFYSLYSNYIYLYLRIYQILFLKALNQSKNSLQFKISEIEFETTIYEEITESEEEYEYEEEFQEENIEQYYEYDDQQLMNQKYQLPKLGELQIDQMTHTTLMILINYIQILESNQQELIKMINAIVTELPQKLNQKVSKYIQSYQQNVIDKQLKEINEVTDSLTKYLTKKQKSQNIDMKNLQQRVNNLQKKMDQTQLQQLFDDVKQIKSILQQLQKDKQQINNKDQTNQNL